MWTTNVRQINGYSWQPVNSSVVCSDHFDVSSWEKVRNDGKRKLKFDAVPSIFNNLAQVSANDHTYSRTLKDITNRMEINKSHLSSCDHTYSSKAVSNNKHLLTLADSSIKKTSVITSTSTAEKNISKIESTSEIESNLIDNGNPDILLNNSDVTNICTITPSNALNNLSELMEEVENAITVETIKEKNIDIITMSLKKENEQLKNELVRVKKIADKIHRENETLRKSNKKLRQEKEIFTNIKKETDKNVLKIFNKDQKKAIYRNNYQSVQWESNTVKKALILRSKCGSSGYKEVQKHIPLPSIRTLQRKTKHIEFRPGILQQTFDLLAEQIKHNTEDWKNCVLALDEMSIEPGEMFDPSTKEFIGKTTLASHSGIANKVLVFLLGGITVRWKQTVCFHLTGSKPKDAKQNATGQVYADIIKDIIERGERIGLRIHCVVSDMGSDNRSMWKVFGIMANRSEVISSIPHPVRSSSRLYIMPDVPHLFKSIRSMIVNNKILYLPQDIVESENLPSNEVKLEHFLEIYNTEKNLELKVAYRMKKENLDKNNHFNKMKVSTSKSIFCQRSSSALQLLALVKQDPCYITTAWFVHLVNHWFDLMTSRYYTLALNKNNKEAYEKAISHLKLTMKTFSEMAIGTDLRWKPVQCGVLIATSAILDLQEYFLDEKGFKFLLTGRFNQDFLENLFSCIRFRQAVPNVLMFKNLLKAISTAQFCTIEKSSYDADDGEMTLDFLTNSQYTTYNNPGLNLCIEIPIVADENISYFSMWERQILYDMAGSTLNSLKNVCTICDTCYNALLWQEKEPHPYGLLTTLNAYKDDCLTQVSEEAFKAIWKAELTFRIVREDLLKTEKVNVYDTFVQSLQYVWATSIVSQCHNITTKLLRRYFSMRYKQFGQLKREQQKKSNNSHSSKSKAMHNWIK